MARIASMSVYDGTTGKEVPQGSTLRDARGDEYRLVAASTPTVPGKSGRVYVSKMTDGRAYGRHAYTSELYAHIFGVYVAGWMDCGCPVGPDAGGHQAACKAATTRPRFCRCHHGIGAHGLRGCSAPQCECSKYEAPASE